MGNRCGWRWAVAMLLGFPLTLGAQELDPAPVERPRAVPVLRAQPLAGPAPALDGHLDDPAWVEAPVAAGFVVYEPDEGAEPSEATEARVLYGADALYVGIRAHDRSPAEIVAQLARRDEEPYSDWLEVVIDSYHDRRTAFRFAVNPAGVKRDTYHFDDTNEDASWDAVWDVATAVDDGGWAAEFRIPYSQLRFGPDPDQTWGINFQRVIARHQETSVWAPLSRGEAAVVSRFGRLTGLQDLQPPRRLEVLPYSLARLTSAPGSAEDPFYDRHDYFSTAGADLKYGVTSNLTLDVTINPDFGQVEADPGQVNLTAFETFFREQRPFFIEGANIFNFRFSGGDGDGANEGLFYSRRIGRPPQGSTPSGMYDDAPARTSILGAMKLSGKTPSGWSLGLLNAVTGREDARLGEAGSVTGRQVVEPTTNYGVARVQKDFRDGKSAAGIISTWTHRGGDAAELLLHDAAYTGGFDARHRFGGDRYEVSGYLLGSHVTGSAEAIARTQEASARYFQRPDADHVELDPTRTALSGWSGSATFSRIAGMWRYATGVLARSPGFEANDLGFMREADRINPFVWIGHNHYTPSEHFQRWNLNLNAWTGYSFGGERYNLGGNVNGSWTFSNFWGGYLGVVRNGEGLSSTMLRGGPLFLRDPSWGGWAGLWSDSRKAVRISLHHNWQVRAQSDSWNANTNLNVEWRPSSQANLSAGPFATRRAEDLQWVQETDAGYVFGRLDQTTVGLTLRADWTFTPTLSLQLYAQPFVSAGSYDDYKTVAEPRAARYVDRIRSLDPVAGPDGDLSADIDGDGSAEAFSRPDFNVKQFRSNAVLRWEYRPGSTLFVVWSQGRDHTGESGAFSLRGDLGTMFDQRPEDVFLVKMSYWIG